MDPESYEDVAMIDYYQDAWTTVNFLLRPIFTTTRQPDYILELANTKAFGLIQIPLWLYITDSVMDDLPLSKVLIQMKDPDDHDTIDEIVYNLSEVIDDSSVTVAS